MKQTERIQLNLYLSGDLDRLDSGQLEHCAILLIQRLAETTKLLRSQMLIQCLAPLEVDEKELTDKQFYRQN